MKSLRKSLNGTKESLRSQISTPLPSVSKPPSSILPPQKVIRALSDYRPQAPQELPFQKGDFFYVLGNVDNSGIWYEAHNPVSGARGLVPRSMFEEFNKNNAVSRVSQSGPPSSRPLQPIQPDRPPPGPKPKTNVFYAVVLHDFEAERTDELDAKTGDPISVVAQSNREWFVAKPIGKIGRPGLIPVSFVEVRDPVTGNAITDVNALMDRGDVPKVEDWKRAMTTYKQNSIALGVIDTPNRDSVPFSPNGPYSSMDPTINVQAATPSPNRTHGPDSDQTQRLSSIDTFPEGILLSANVISFHYEMDEFWFRIDAVFQPYGPPGTHTLPPAKQLVLFRVYNDFYDFQVSLLNTFPREAGREPPHPRILPYMPGPADEIDQEVTATRQVELNEYLCKLCELSSVGARYILEDSVIREFLLLKPGDVESDTAARTEEVEALFAQNYDEATMERQQVADVQNGLGRLKVGDRDGGNKSDGSEYEDEGYAASPQRANQDGAYGNEQWNERRPSFADSTHSLRHQAHAHNHQRNESPSPYGHASSRSNSPLPNNNNSSYPYSQSASTSSLRSSQASSFTGRSRSHSTATSNLTNPTISVANPQTAFVKIKVFDSLSQELVAIRVHPKVTHAELLEKVQARLGGEVSVLKYRDSLSNQLFLVDSDDELRAWMDGTDRYMLYAD
ncbi:hypothetical protein AB1N83_002912 [Pleurotus pulmonarius]|nr:bud emergence protein 1 [Pleurotus pulmonarius]KAF4600715.1 bud emergence protein 1 [Pleurotus pulmonarius]